MRFFSLLKKWGIIKSGSSSGMFNEFVDFDPLNQNFVDYGKGQKKPISKAGAKKGATVASEPPQQKQAKTPWRIAILGWILIVILIIRGFALWGDKTFIWGFWGIFLFWIFMAFYIRIFIRFIKNMLLFIVFMFLTLVLFMFPYLSGHELREGAGQEITENKASTEKVDCDTLIKEYNNKVFKLTTNDSRLQGEFGITVFKTGDACAYTRGVSFKLNEQLPTNYATANRDSRATPQNYIAKVTYEDDGGNGFGTTALFPAFCQKDKMPNPFGDWRSTDIYTSCTSQNSTNATSDVLYSHRSNQSQNMDATDVKVMKRFFTASKLEIYDASAFVECTNKDIGGTMSKSCSINFDKAIQSAPIRTYTLKSQE